MSFTHPEDCMCHDCLPGQRPTTPPKGPAERAADCAKALSAISRLDKHWLDMATTIITAEYASIEQEKEKLKQLQDETEISLLIIRADHARLHQENQRLREALVILTYPICKCGANMACDEPHYDDCPIQQALATDKRG